MRNNQTNLAFMSKVGDSFIGTIRQIILVQAINQFLTSKPYFSLTPFLQFSKGCGVGGVLEQPNCILVVLPSFYNSQNNTNFTGVFCVFWRSQSHVIIVWAGPELLFKKTTIARICALMCAVIFALVGSALSASKAYATDNFPGNTITGTSGSFTDTNVGATGEAGEPATFGGGNLNTIWYSWVAPVNGTFYAQTCSQLQTTFDTTLKGYTGAAVGALTNVAANDDACLNNTVNAYASAISFAVVAGTSYRIQVDGYNNDTGSFQFSYAMSPIVSISNTTNGAEATPTNGVMTVAMPTASATATTISYTVTGTATSGTDFTALSGTVTIPALATSATVTIPVINDLIVEGAETVIVTLTGVTAGTATIGGANVATNTIADNDAATVTIANTTNGNETGAVAGVMTVTQTLASSTNTVLAYTVSGTATSGSDFTALSGTVTIPAGSTTAVINIPTIDDAIVEGAETVIVTITGVTSGLATLGATLVATNTLADNDTATVSVANTTNAAEPATNGVITVTQSNASTTATVLSYTVSGTATSGTDFTALSGTVTIPALATTATISIPVINDLITDPGETVIITLTAVTSGVATLGAPLAATNTIADDDVGTITIVTTDNAATETAGNTGAFTVVFNLQPSASITVTIGTSTQCTFAPTPLTFTTANWNVAQTVTVTPVDDAIVEGAHTCSPASITAANDGYTGVTGTPPTINIADNDSATLSLANTTNGTEAGPVSGVMTVTQTAVSATNTVAAYSIGGTAASGSDFTALSGTVTIPAGSTTATITIPTLDDAIVEGAETVIITLTSVTSGLATLSGSVAATNTIADNDSATVSLANTTNGAETGPASGVMTVTQTAISATNTVLAYSVGGTATSGSDFTALSGTVTIPAGAMTATITIPVLNDAIVETPETVLITLTSVTSGLATLSGSVAATNTIADNDSATVSLANTTNGAEPGTNGVMTLTQTAVSATNTVVSYSVGGSAASGTDYTALSGTVTIPAGSITATVSIAVLDDAIVEGSETVLITLTSVTSGLATLSGSVVATNTIADNDSATVSLANTTNGAEPGTNGVMTVTQTAISSVNTVLAYSVGGTATSGSDFTILSGTVTIPAGSTSATIWIPVLDDAIVEGSETALLTLTSVTSGLATLSGSVAASNTIADNDSATVSLANTTNGAETGPVSGVMTVTQTAVSATNTVLAYSVGGTATTGSDYTALSGTVTIPAGSTTATITIPVINDVIVEGSETVLITLTSVTSGLATLSASVTATNTIADNDSATVGIANTTNAAEPATNGVMTLTQTAVSAANTVIAYSIGGTATSGSDYAALSGTVTIPAGSTTATIAINVIDNLVVEPSETVIVTLTSVTSGLATLGAPLVATNTIADNDVASFTIVKAVNTANVTTPSTLTYTITVANTGNVPLTIPVITDTLTQGGALTLTSGPTLTSGDFVPLGTLDASETWVYTATYAVTQANINNGTTISNVSTFDTAETPLSTSNTATTTITQSPSMTVVKSSSTGGPVSAGTIITYSFTVKNTGNITLSNIVLADTHNGFGTPPTPANELLFLDATPLGDTIDGTSNNSIWSFLAPGDEVVFTAPYTVVQQDVDLLQ